MIPDQAHAVQLSLACLQESCLRTHASLRTERETSTPAYVRQDSKTVRSLS